MRILLSNDDGYFAPGLAALFESLAGLGEIMVVAPEQNRSGASNSLTLDRPLFLKKASSGFHFVNGTPTDCVHLGLNGLLEQTPDMVVSGINLGANLGDRLACPYHGVEVRCDGTVTRVPASPGCTLEGS